MPPWAIRKKQRTEGKGSNFILPGDVMTTSKVNVMGKDLNMFYHKLLNLGEIPRISKAYVDANRAPPDIMRTDKVNKMTKKLDMNNFEILNLPHPTALDSVASKRYVDENLTVLPADMVTRSKNLSFLNDLKMNNRRITNLKLPQEDTDAISKKIFDDKTAYMMLTTKENDMEKPLNMNSHRIKELADPVDQWDSVHKTYADKHLSRMPVVSDPDKGVDNKMHTPLDMNNHEIFYLKTNKHTAYEAGKFNAVNREFLKIQFDDKLMNVVSQSVPLIKNDFDFNNNKLLNLKDDNSLSSRVTKKYVDEHLPDMTNVMKTTQVNKMQQDIDMNQRQILNLKEIPAASKVYVDSKKLPLSVMETTKVNIMGEDLNMNNHKLLNLTGIPESIKTYIDLETKLKLDNATSFFPFNGTPVDASGIITRLENNKLLYRATILPYVGYYSFYSDESETLVGENHWLKVHRPYPIQSSDDDTEIKSEYCGVTYNRSTRLFVLLKPYLIYKLTSSVFTQQQVGSTYYFKRVLPGNYTIKTICKGRLNQNPCKALAWGREEITVGVHISLSAAKVTHRTIEIEVMGAYKPGFF